MLKHFILSSAFVSLFYSCGNSSSSQSSGGTTPPTATTCNISQSSGLISQVKSSHFIYEEFFKDKGQTSLDKIKGNILLNSKPSLKIVGGDTISTWTNTNCMAGSKASGSGYYNIATTNPVAILIPDPSTPTNTALCTGAFVSTTPSSTRLILTAGHCFKPLIDYETTAHPSYSAAQKLAQAKIDFPTANGGKVTFTNTYSNTTYQVAISSWSAHPSYHQPLSNSDLSYALNDIAWIKVATLGNNSYAPVKIIASPSSVSATEEKLMIGFGANTGTSESNAAGAGPERCVSTYADTNYATRGDILPNGASLTFNLATSANAYENYLTVIGPINGSNPRGTCYGDSGGPVYVYRNGGWVIYALTQGSNSVVSPKPSIDFSQCTSSANLNTQFDSSNFATCQDGYGIYTTVGNYASWINSDASVTLGTQ